MADVAGTNSGPNTQPSWVTTMGTLRKESAIGLAILAVVFAGLAILWGVWGVRGAKLAREGPTTQAEKPLPGEEKDEAKDKDKEKSAKSPDYLPAAVWAGLLAIMAGGGAWYAYAHPLPEIGRASVARAEVLTVGSIFGLATALLGALLLIRWNDSLFKWVNDGTVKEARWVLIAASIFTLGLFIMFLSLQMARAEERANATLRRMLYGFNAVFLGMLLFLVLIAVNVISFLKVPTTLLTTDRAFTELAEPSKKFLRTLDKPVHVYLILPEKYSRPIETRGGHRVPYERLYADCRVMLEQCEEQSPAHFTASYLSPGLDASKIAALKSKFKLKLSDPEAEIVGMVVAVGDKESPTTAFLPVNDLVDTMPVGPGMVGITFEAENRLLTEVANLVDSRENEVIYFTQDNGEASITGGKRSCATIVQFLRDRKFKVETLSFEKPGTKVPANAAAVVVVGPETPFAPDGTAMKALREYLRPTAPDAKPGKLLAYLPAIRGARGEVIPTGLEELIAEYGVNVSPNRRIVTPPDTIPIGQSRRGMVFVPSDSVVAGAYAELTLPIAETLSAGRAVLKNCRPVTAVPGGPGTYRTHALMGTPTRAPTWQEADWNTPAAEFIRQLEAADEEGARKLAAERLVGRASVTVGMAVTEGSGSDPRAPGKPRLIVFGSDTMLLDGQDLDLGNQEYRALSLADSLDWLRERNNNLGIPPRKTNLFQLGKGPDIISLLTLLGVMVIGIGGLGIGVWLSRRR